MELTDAIDGLKKHRDRIANESAWQRPETLSEIATRMAAGNSYLGDHLASSHAAYLQKRADVYRREINNGNSATGADNVAKNETVAERESYETIKFLHKDISSLITVMQTRLKVMGNEANTNI